MLYFTPDELEHQYVLDGRRWSVTLPRNPVFRFHLIVVVKDESKHTFSDLDDADLRELRTCITRLHTKMAHACRHTYDGYNLFSNNGSTRIGQHAGQFHQHVFLRFTDEDESPYAVMARGERWAADATDEWTATPT